MVANYHNKLNINILPPPFRGGKIASAVRHSGGQGELYPLLHWAPARCGGGFSLPTIINLS